MTIPYSQAWYELHWSMNFRDNLEFKGRVSVGQLVFKYDAEAYAWRPYWVVDGNNDGLYEIISAYDNKRIEGVSADKLGIAVNAKGKTYNETH